VEWGKALFDLLGVPRDKPEVASVGAAVEEGLIGDLTPLRPDLLIQRSRQAREFNQYTHLNAAGAFEDAYQPLGGQLDRLTQLVKSGPRWDGRRETMQLIRAVQKLTTRNHEQVTRLLAAVPADSLLRTDLAVARLQSPSAPRLLLAISSKWSLRTDRAQDCVSQGAKLVSLRRGPMPLFGVITMEPRPSMLRLLTDGSGAIDFVYHLALPELRQAAQMLEEANPHAYGKQRRTLERMISQGRLKPYSALRREIENL